MRVLTPLPLSFGTTPANEDPTGSGTKFTYNLRFPGQYYDAETGKHYNYFRDYDPSTGRYVESDPTGLDGGMNTYTYVGGNPLIYTDPYGLLPRWMVPNNVVNNAQYTVNQITGNSFTPQELSKITDAIISDLSLSQAIQFKDIPAGSTVELTKQQDDLVKKIIDDLITDSPKDPLFQKVRDEYEKAKKNGTCKVK